MALDSPVLSFHLDRFPRRLDDYRKAKVAQRAIKSLSKKCKLLSYNLATTTGTRGGVRTKIN